MKRFIIISIAALLLTAALGAQDGVDLGGHVRTDVLAPTGWNDDYTFQKISTELLLSATYSGDHTGLYGEIYFTVDELAAITDFTDALSVSPGEIYLSLYYNGVDIKLGRQKISWGSLDGVNPSDVINPVDMSSLLNMAANDASSIRIPVEALRLDVYPTSNVNIEYIFVPLFTAPGMPSVSDYLPPELSGMGVSYSYPSPAMYNFETGLRTSFYLSAMDFSLSYYYGWDDVPDIAAIGVLQQDIGGGNMFGSPVNLALEFNRVHNFGGDFAVPVGGLDLRGEATFTLTGDTTGTDPYVKNPYLYYGLGAGYNFDGGLMLNMQLTQKYVFNYQKVSDYSYVLDPADPASWNQSDSWYAAGYAASFSPLLSDQRGQLTSSVMLVLEKSYLDDFLSTRLVTLYNFPGNYDDNDTETHYGDFMIKPSVSYELADAFDVEFGGNLFFSYKKDDNGDIVSDEYRTFGMLDKSDSLYLELKYSF